MAALFLQLFFIFFIFTVLHIYEKYFGFGMRSYFASVISDQSVKSKQNLLFLIEMLNFSYSKLAIEALCVFFIV